MGPFRNLTDGIGLAISMLIGAMAGHALGPVLLSPPRPLDVTLVLLFPYAGAILGGIAWKADGWFRKAE